MAEQIDEDHGWGTADGEAKARPVGLIATLAVALALIVGVGVFFYSETYRSPSGTQVAQSVGTSVVNGVSMPHVTLSFQTYPDSTGSVNGVQIHPSGNPGWPAYGLTNVYQVPAHALVTVNVRQYDSGGSLNNPWFATVRGTVGGTATIDGKVVRAIDPDNVGHTFTVRDTRARTRISSSTSPSRRWAATIRPTTASTTPSCSASCRGARASTPGTASSPVA